jgi:pimeloyl-ACP methyl ester carboxylesterase
MRTAAIIILVVTIVVAAWTFRGCGDRAVDLPAGTEPATEVKPPADSAATPGPDGRRVDIGGHRLLIRTYGAGSPAVVIEPGIGDALSIWRPVIDILQNETEVVLYARAGYPGSDPGPMPRSADRVVRELTQLLVDTPIEPPYVIVGHSLGATHALLYASEHPNLVAGVVLLDPPPVGFMNGERFPELRVMATEMTAAYRRDAKLARDNGNEEEAVKLETIASEHEQMFESGWQWVSSVTSLGDTPLVVVASGVPNEGFGDAAAEFQEYWRESSERTSRLSTRGRFVYAKDSTHDLPGDATQTVVDAVRWCLERSAMEPDDAGWTDEK